MLSYKDNVALDHSHTFHMFRMVTSCFPDNSNPTLVADCQHPDTKSFSDIIPVTSQITGYTYWNKPCAICNDDDDDIIEWTPNVLIKTSMPYFANSSAKWKIPYPDSYELLSNILNSKRFADVIYTPPESQKPTKCMKEELIPVRDCKQASGEVESTISDWLLESCRKFVSPVHHGPRDMFHRNIFCLVCHISSIQFIANKSPCGSEEPMKALPGYLTALLNYKIEADQPVPSDNKEETCNCIEIFDPYLVSHRK